MKILKIIHGYPERFSAGSEVYSQMLAHSLVDLGHEVTVFTRQEDPYKKEFFVDWEEDSLNPKVQICLINVAHGRDGYRHVEIDNALKDLIDKKDFDVAHIGHLNHLSTSLIKILHEKQIPTVFTLHDFWLMCPRGQFLQSINTYEKELYPLCDKQENTKCALKCYRRYFSQANDKEDLAFWTRWVEKRMEHVKKMCSLVDVFIAPSKYLYHRFTSEFTIPKSKLIYLDYGFDLSRLKNRQRIKEPEFVFGYIGTHNQAKGIALLLEAFSKLKIQAKLKIWGSDRPPFTSSLKNYTQKLPEPVRNNIEWLGGYPNSRIVEEVFNHLDAIVVPSIWGENSPLVIHEALQAKLPIITANYGGMGEYIQHNVNGLLFEHRNADDLMLKMQELVQNQEIREKISKGGYLQSSDGNIPDHISHAKEILKIYHHLILNREESSERRTLAHHL